MTNLISGMNGFNGYPEPLPNYGLPYSRVLPSPDARDAYALGMGYPPNGIYQNGYPTLAQVKRLPGSVIESEGPWTWKLQKIFVGDSGPSFRFMSPNVDDRLRNMAVVMGSGFSLGKFFESIFGGY